jgi:peptidoglycan/LPS O-acetylase OafA/YrhL
MKNKKHFYWLDWMRFIAAFMVVICHSRGYNWVEGGVFRMTIRRHL